MESNFLNKKTKKFSMYETILLIIMALIIGFSIGGIITSRNIAIKTNKVNDKYLNEFIKNYEFILDNYYEEIDKEKLINSAISGMTESLGDPYSVYFDENKSDNFSITLNGTYNGIGIQILKDEKTGYMVVAGVFKDSPSEEAGIKVGDKIISIDDTNSVDMSSSDFSKLIKSSNETEHSLKILRGKDELNIKINKSNITLKSVTSKMYELNNKKIGYIYIGIFASNTYSQFNEELTKLENKKIDSLIIDIRGNSGGQLTAVEQILDIFLNSKQIMYKFEQNKKITTTYGTGNDNKKYEIVLLCDNSSASASEVLIAGLKENLNSTIIGQKTYGKGTVQKLVTLSNGTQYKITIKKWLTPKGNWVNETNGITPDIDIEMNDKYYETYEDVDDTQLQRALEYLKSK